MAEYIDREKLLELIDSRVPVFYDEHYQIKDLCTQVIENAPIEDVVPRSEVERLENQLDNLSNQYRAGAEFLCNQAKQEVAKQILKEVDIIKQRYYIGAYDVVETIDEITETIKKYIGEDTDVPTNKGE